jgi:hypothetical protein
MKTLNPFISLVLLALAAGCRSHSSQSVSDAENLPPAVATEPTPNESNPATADARKSTIIDEGTSDGVSYRIESIPNPLLTPTSREGDKNAGVYSTNIIGVFVHRNNEPVDAHETAAPVPANNAQPEN